MLLASILNLSPIAAKIMVKVNEYVFLKTLRGLLGIKGSLFVIYKTIWISIHFSRHLEFRNASIITLFITFLNPDDSHTKRSLLHRGSLFLVYSKENYKMIVWRRISLCFYRHLQIWNPSIIGHFITYQILGDGHTKMNLLYRAFFGK